MVPVPDHPGAQRPQRGGIMSRRLMCSAIAFAVTLGLTAGVDFARAQGTIKITYTDPLSGPFAQVGDQNLQQFKYIID